MTDRVGWTLSEAALLARDFEGSPLWRIAGVREGAITIQQQAERFAATRDDHVQADAAIWAREGCQMLSSSLPDTYTGAAHDEGSIGWQTVHDISSLFGTELVWSARVRLAFTPRLPDSVHHDADPDYLRGLLAIAGLTQRRAAQSAGVSERMMRYYLERKGDGSHQVPPYSVQYALEMLARQALPATWGQCK